MEIRRDYRWLRGSATPFTEHFSHIRLGSLYLLNIFNLELSMPRAKGSKNRKTLEREKAKTLAAAYAELVKNVPPLDFSMPLDSLDVMEQAMRHYYFQAKIEERLGDGADLRRVGDAYREAVRVAEKVARYRHAQLSAMQPAGDINAKKYDHLTLDELAAELNANLRKLGPLIEIDLIREQEGGENRMPMRVNGSG
jgi:hypothetical protein